MNASLKRISRERVYSIQPALTQSLLRLGEAAKNSLPVSLVHLIKIRVSQINGCAFCVGVHMDEARRDGEKQTRLDVISVWQEARCYSAPERMALLWAEALTNIQNEQVPDSVYEQAVSIFSEEELINLTACIIEINGWNRIAVSFRF